jgi:hypothetical protein
MRSGNSLNKGQPGSSKIFSARARPAFKKSSNMDRPCRNIPPAGTSGPSHAQILGRNHGGRPMPSQDRYWPTFPNGNAAINPKPLAAARHKGIGQYAPPVGTLGSRFLGGRSTSSPKCSGWEPKRILRKWQLSRIQDISGFAIQQDRLERPRRQRCNAAQLQAMRLICFEACNARALMVRTSRLISDASPGLNSLTAYRAGDFDRL